MPAAISVPDGAVGDQPNYQFVDASPTRIESAFAIVNATGATGDCYPTLTVTTQDGRIIGRFASEAAVPGGMLAAVTWAVDVPPSPAHTEFAPHAAEWTMNDSNPGTVIASPCVVRGYVVNSTGRASPVSVVVSDGATGLGMLPGPGSLGANVQLPFRIYNSLVIEVIDSLTLADIGAADLVTVTFFYSDLTA